MIRGIQIALLRGLLFACVFYSQVTRAQQAADTTYKINSGVFSDSKLQQYRKSADDYYASFKNRYALDELKKMDAAADSLAVAELQKAESDLKQKQEAETKEQVAKISEQNALIKSLEEQNNLLMTERNKLWRKAILSIVVWLILVALFVIYRLRMLRKTNKVLDQSAKALANNEKFYERGGQLIQKAMANQAILKEAEKVAAELKQSSGDASAGDLLNAAVESIKKIATLNNSVLLLAKEAAEEKADAEKSDVNNLCEQMVSFANHGIETEDGVYHFTISKDFEKKLPAVKGNEQGIAKALLFLISNALNACYRQSKSGVKGYQPKITVSTRVLPRFVQIKIKDNGSGVADNIMEEIYDPFYTTETGKKAGQGLTLAKKIIAENKGELKIESSLDRGTDVTIKLFT